MTHTAAPIAKRLASLHEHLGAHETAAEQATREAKEALLAKVAERDEQAPSASAAGDGDGAS